jgi:GT2 family glycosyltransferase
MNSEPRVTVVVLSHNRPQLLEESLASLEKQVFPAAQLEVIVVDNRSPRSAAIADIVAKYPSFRLLAHPTNLGFTGGMNAGINAASGDYVYLVEDDIVLHPENVGELVRYLEAHPAAGVVSGILHARETGKIWFAGGHLRLGVSPQIDLPHRDEVNSGQLKTPFPVSYVCGATMMARREMWNELRGFREDFFMYEEDVELCLRVILLGKSLVIVPSAWADHFTPAAGRNSPLLDYHKRKNLFALYALHGPSHLLLSVYLRHGVYVLLRNPSSLVPGLRAWAHFGRSLPRLLADRRRLRATPGGRLS